MKEQKCSGEYVGGLQLPFVGQVQVNTGGTNAFTVAGDTGNTLVGSGVVAASNSHEFRTTKTAANTFTTYRI
jgi:hypothetical protein